MCHLSDFSGQNQMPRLSGQREAYLEAEMLAYRDGSRTGADTIMAASLYGVTDADIKALAHYLSRRLKKGSGPFSGELAQLREKGPDPFSAR